MSDGVFKKNVIAWRNSCSLVIVPACRLRKQKVEIINIGLITMSNENHPTVNTSFPKESILDPFKIENNM